MVAPSNPAGSVGEQEQAQALERADIVLLLITPDFLADDFCYDQTLNRALQRHEAGQARVIPIHVRPSDWQNTALADLQPLPIDGRAITTWTNEDEAWADVTAGLRRAIEDLSLSPTSNAHSALPPIWTVPFPRNSFFTGRSAILEHVHTQLQTTNTATALTQHPQAISGLGGIGKTQIALEYAYRYASEYQAVFWANADQTETLYASYTAIAAALKLPERFAPDQERTVAAVKDWLQNNRHWLLILDNADHLATLLPFLPPTSGGHILITTRAWDMQRLATRVRVDELPEEEGATLLLQRAGLLASNLTLTSAPKELQTQALLLTKELGGLPLALDQAGAYLEATGMDLTTYHQIYQKQQLVLLAERRSLVQDHPESVATTWALSFERVANRNPAAAELLRFCAFLAPDAIPETNYYGGRERSEPTACSTGERSSAIWSGDRSIACLFLDPA